MRNVIKSKSDENQVALVWLFLQLLSCQHTFAHATSWNFRDGNAQSWMWIIYDSNNDWTIEFKSHIHNEQRKSFKLNESHIDFSSHACMQPGLLNIIIRYCTFTSLFDGTVALLHTMQKLLYDWLAITIVIVLFCFRVCYESYVAGPILPVS